MKKIIGPRLVTFDVTGTLLQPMFQQYKIIAERHGFRDFDESRLARSFKQSYKKLEKQHPIFGRNTGLGWENWWRTVVSDVFMDQDSRIEREKLDIITENLIETYKTRECWHVYPGATELLDYLKGRSITMGVISNFDVRLHEILESVSLRSYFAFVLTSYDLGAEKPSPAIFKEALRLATQLSSEIIHPNEAVHIGDRVDNDYRGARLAGWNAIFLSRQGETIDEGKVKPSDVFTNLKDVRRHFEKLLSKNIGNVTT